MAVVFSWFPRPLEIADEYEFRDGWIGILRLRSIIGTLPKSFNTDFSLGPPKMDDLGYFYINRRSNDFVLSKDNNKSPKQAPIRAKNHVVNHLRILSMFTGLLHHLEPASIEPLSHRKMQMPIGLFSTLYAHSG